MFSRRRAHSVLLLALALVVLPGPANVLSAQDEPLKANIVITLSATDRGGASHMRAAGGDALKTGETRTDYLYAGADGGPTGVSAGRPFPSTPVVSGGTLTARVADGRVGTSPAHGWPPALKFDYVWKVDVKPVSIAADGITFEIDWKRSETKDGTMQPTVGDHRTVTLRQGEKHLLDFAACSPPDGPRANIFLDVQASLAEDPAFANAAFDYDLWLTHQTSDGTKITRHAVAVGRQGERVDFAFTPIPLPLDAGSPAEAPSPYHMDVSGAITGRLKADGTIEICLESRRKQPLGSGASGYGTGVKVIVVRPDETTSVALPAFTGPSSFRSQPATKLTSPRRGVTVSADTVRVDAGTYFEGATTSILVTVKRQRQE